MPHHNILKTVVFIILSAMLSSCSVSAPPQSSWGQSNPSRAIAEVEVQETGSQVKSSIELIHINNCGGKADSKQAAERSFAVNVEGTIGASIGYAVVQGSISAKYGQYRNVTKRQEIAAPAGTNMEVTLQWTEREWIGTILGGGQSGTYNARSPIAVEQISSRDLGCSTASANTPEVANITEAPTADIRPTPLPTQEISASPTLAPAPTAIPETPQGTILELGQTWYQGNKSITISSVAFSSSEYFYIDGLDITNIGTRPVNFEFVPESFLVKSNRGETGKVEFGWISSPLILSPGESYSISGHNPWIRVNGLSTAEQSVNEIVISLSVPGVTNARWRVPIDH